MLDAHIIDLSGCKRESCRHIRSGHYSRVDPCRDPGARKARKQPHELRLVIDWFPRSLFESLIDSSTVFKSSHCRRMYMKRYLTFRYNDPSPINAPLCQQFSEILSHSLENNLWIRSVVIGHSILSFCFCGLSCHRERCDGGMIQETFPPC
jgi:hypothetical protein